MYESLDQARAFARTMSDAELVDETTRGIDDLSHAGWQAVHEEVSRRGLRVRPWRNDRTILNELREQARHLGADAVIDVRFSYGEVPVSVKKLLMVAGVGTAVQLTRLPGAPIRDLAGETLPPAPVRRTPADLPSRPHTPRFPGITDSPRR